MDVDAPAEPPPAPAPTGAAWLPDVRRQHLDVEVGTAHRAGGFIVGSVTMTCRPPPPGSGDVRLVALHAHELVVERVTIDDAPARVVRRGGVDVSAFDDDADDDDGAPAAPRPPEPPVPAAVAVADAADAARADARHLAGGLADEIVIARRDAGIVASAPPLETREGADPSEPTGAPVIDRRPDVVVKVWYAAGTALGDAVPDAWGNQNHENTTKHTTVASSVASSAKLPAETGWSVPGYGALSCFEDPEARDGSSGSAGSSASRFVVAPGPARRPAAWFPCVDDARSLVLFSVRARVPADCVAVAPGVPVDLPEDADDEDDASPTRAFAFDSGGIPTQAHQMCLAVGTFATKRKARETASREEEGAAQQTETATARATATDPTPLPTPPRRRRRLRPRAAPRTPSTRLAVASGRSRSTTRSALWVRSWVRWNRTSGARPPGPAGWRSCSSRPTRPPRLGAAASTR